MIKPDNFSLEKYLERIAFDGKCEANIDSIRQIIHHQLFHVPFENLDVQAGKIVSLEPEAIVEKIIDQKRGGYCYEVSGLFAMALEELDIPYQFVAARPMFYPVKRPKTHMAIVFELDHEKWFCDLGFGSYGPREPINLNALDQEHQQDYDTFLLTRSKNGEYLFKALVDGEWTSQYEFNLSPQEWIDFSPANYMNSTHPDTIFVQKLLVLMHTPEGRKILFGDHFKTIHKGQSTIREIAPDEIPNLLKTEFGLSTNG